MEIMTIENGVIEEISSPANVCTVNLAILSEKLLNGKIDIFLVISKLKDPDCQSF